MQKAKAQSAMRPPFLALAFTFVTAVILALLMPPRASHAQGIVRGAQQGAYEGSRVAGPVGGIVGGAVGAGVGGAVGAVEGVFGTPYYRSRHSSTPRQSRSVARREQRVPTGKSQPGSTPPAPQDQAAPQAAAPARPATIASTAPPVQATPPAPQDQAVPQAAAPATTASTAPPVQPLE